MNKHTRLVASLLFVVIIILAAAITPFYLNVPDDTGSKTSQAEIVRRLMDDGKGNCIFSDGSGEFGIADSEDRIIVAPEWREIRFAGNGICIAASKSGSRMIYGCIDYEGNIVIPFIYSDIKNGRRTEVDTISGSVVAAGKKVGVPTPTHDMVVTLMHALEGRVLYDLDKE